ncbi:hypothetical protein [Rheinheimera aquimaris]|uniref:hypothetical protein n=1 Tax=Rheinheimera aquimaris TaxID=412437 RepID=UPI001066A2A4|nr:hypothetical protein [Rheinheimera aquimaris]
MLRNKPLLLTILAILVLARFVLVPLQQQQQAQYQQLDALTKRLQRSEALLQQKQKLELLQTEQQQYLDQLLQPFPVAANSSQYRLQLQQQLQKLATAQGASVTFFDWLSDTPLQVFNLQRSRVSLRVKGTAANVMLLHTQIEQQFPHFMFRDIKASWRGVLNQQSEIELTLLFEADYLLQEVS